MVGARRWCAIRDGRRDGWGREFLERATLARGLRPCPIVAMKEANLVTVRGRGGKNRLDALGVV